MAIAFPFSPSTDILWNLLPYSSTDFPTLLSATNEGFKLLWTWCFSPTFLFTCGTAPVTQPGTTWIHKRTKIPNLFMYLWHPVCTLKWLHTARRTLIIEPAKLHVVAVPVKTAMCSKFYFTREWKNFTKVLFFVYIAVLTTHCYFISYFRTMIMHQFSNNKNQSTINWCWNIRSTV